jgi:hypothetical protein
MSFLSRVLTTDMHLNTIRFAPPLIISESQVDSAVDSLTEVLEESLHRLSSAAGRNLWLEHHRENEAGFQTKQTGRQPSRRVRRKYPALRLVLEAFGEGQSSVSLC